ncbi:phage exclusion protein Lit family protein [Ciceribacter sp. T2.26MG-112.2]|uniref:phage exclusion protein Lit family protein n=1 Tax=Ciceribacter sp. T2.26MG-112.2 TaxID=3137154 RepID=UPI0012B69598|nr:phage exclusion protein Lit family protein [Ciceribacter naphthalenivorans]
MDVSEAVDRLFSGVVPERIDELSALWGAQQDRVRLLDTPRFLLQQRWGTIQVSELALRQLWLAGYAAWRAIEAYNIPLAVFPLADFAPDQWSQSPAQAEKEAAFERLFDKIIEIGDHGVEGFDWPEDVPYPREGLEISDPEKKGTFDLVCMAGAYVFAHEIRHGLFEHAGDTPADEMGEERACDEWALSLMLDQVASYAVASGWAPELVRSKRLMGIIIAQLTITTLTPRENWDNSADHPPVSERMHTVLSAATEPSPDWFWITVTSMLLAFARRAGVKIDYIPSVKSFRDFAFHICDQLKSS